VADGDPGARTASVDVFRHRLDHLHAAGRQLRLALARSQPSDADFEALGVWQRECAATISQLSGGRKSHWLSRAFSNALLVQGAGAESVSVVTIVDRLLEVLDSAARSLADAVVPSTVDGTREPPPTRFASVENAALRSSLERAYLDGQEALARGESALALMTFCSILETVITYALEGYGASRLAAHGPPAEPIVNWPFATRIAMAERAGLISRGCARLPTVARTYRDQVDATGELIAGGVVSLREARLASDVLHVILRDLSPGR
jgi:hypothetical protein